MLSKTDKEWLRAMVREEIKTALEVEVTLEKHRNDETGMPLPVPKIMTIKESIVSFWARYLPYYEGAMRGLQETTDKMNNRTIKQESAIELMAQTMISSEDAFKKLQCMGDGLRKMIELDASPEQPALPTQHQD